MGFVGILSWRVAEEITASTGGNDCPFCDPPAERVFWSSGETLALWDGFPVSPGHALIVPKVHVATWFDAPPDMQRALTAAIELVKREIEKRFQPDGYNVGFNSGAVAGQTVHHLHIHVIPRYSGDVSDPRGGVRHVIPEKGNYQLRDQEGAYSTLGALEELRLTTGPSEPLLPRLRADIDKAVHVDVAVAFTLQSGLNLLFEHFEDLVGSRGGRLRFLTGDYLDVTDPTALRRLLDLAGDVEANVYETKPNQGFHPKAYLCHFPDGSGVAYIGSSNITRRALTDSVEWNFRVCRSHDGEGFSAANRAFSQLLTQPQVQILTHDWVDRYEQRRRVHAPAPAVDVEQEPPEAVPTPHEVQAEALAALQATRQRGNAAGLVVLATGVGKTWLSAFDSNQPGTYDRILFVAHREEILSQALKTFRRIRPDAHLGRYTGVEKQRDADILFASIQTMGRLPHLRNFAPDEFDYIIVDEFHHAAAATYRKLIDYFRPKFLLGLTATPERMDGGDLLGLCQENLVYRNDLGDGISRGLLCPFHYFGVPDEVDYENIPWRGRRFDPEELTAAVATQERARNALDQYEKRAGKRTLVFCCSQIHADFTADYFRQNGLRAVAVHAGANSAPRAASLEQLEGGELDMICAVDMFNEGVDLPNIDTVMLLRPTESSVIWLQQIGRGLRKADGKSHLTIIDYIGNHKSFLTKPMTLFQASASPYAMPKLLEQIRAGEVELPEGCSVTYELEALNILESLVQVPRGQAGAILQAYYEDFQERMGARPTATETFHDGYNPKQTGRQSWLAFVDEMGDLEPAASALVSEHGQFFASLDKTPMTKSYKMVVLQAMLRADRFPGSIEIDDLADGIATIVGRSARLQVDFGDDWRDDKALRDLLERNPIEAWVNAKGTDKQYFGYEQGTFRSLISVPADARDTFQSLTREIVDWRLADYLLRQSGDESGAIECHVIQASGRPIIKLPDGEARNCLPEGWATVRVDNRDFEANFVKIAVNVVREPGSESNVLPGLMRTWFGRDAGQPGTRHFISFEKAEGDWVMKPIGAAAAAAANGPELWRRYSREEIPPLFCLEFNTGLWRQGFVRKGTHMFLLVTLEKPDLAAEFQYQDYFIDRRTFHWQSQNRTTQSSKDGQAIKNHRKTGEAVHLFVRVQKKESNKAAPFYYCGDLDFMSWEGEKPISVTWQLENEVPAKLYELLRRPETPR